MAATQTVSDRITVARRYRKHDGHELDSTRFFVGFSEGEFWQEPHKAISQIEVYVNTTRQQLGEASRSMQDHIRSEYGNDEELLTGLIVRTRTTLANIVFLRDGLVPALKIDHENPKLRSLALEAFGYIRAELEAIRTLMF